MIEIRTPAAPVETVTPLAPAEALRLGRLIRPVEAWSRVFEGANAACAIGAMALGYGLPDPGENDSGRDAYLLVAARVGLPHDSEAFDGIWKASDDAEDGERDAATIAYLESRGL